MKRTISLIAALFLMLGLLTGASAFADGDGVRCYSLVEAGSFSDPMGKVEFWDCVYLEEGDNKFLLNNMGEKVTDYPVLEAEYMGEGVYCVRVENEDPVNNVGLVSAEGDILVPFDAALIEWPENGKNGRFVMICYATERTYNKDECFVYSNTGIRIGGPSAGDEMYKGYSAVFDLDSGKFVENVEKLPQETISCGNSFITEADGHSTAFDANGNILFETDGYVYTGDGIITVREDGRSFIFDDTGAQTFAAEDSLYPYGEYVIKYADGKAQIRDRFGVLLLETKDNVSGAHGDLLKMENDDYDAYLMNVDGNVIVKAKKDQRVSYEGYGIFSVKKGDKYSLVDSSGVIVENARTGNAWSLSVSDGKKMLVLNDKAFSLQLEQDELKVLQPALVAAYSDANAAYGVFDLFTGEQLLPYEYHEIKASGNYLYAYKGGEYTVYEIIAPEY